MKRKLFAVLLALLVLPFAVRATGGEAAKSAWKATEEEAVEIVWEMAGETEEEAAEPVWKAVMETEESTADAWDSASVVSADCVLLDGEEPLSVTPTPADNLTATPTPAGNPTVTPTPTDAPTATPAPTGIPSVTPTPAPENTYHVTVTGGSGSGDYQPGETVTVVIEPAPEGMRLKSVNHTKDVPFTRVTDAEQVTYTFVMPAFDVTVRAVYYESGVYDVTVEGGSGSGAYHEGDTVTVIMDPAPEGMRLKTVSHTKNVPFTRVTGAEQVTYTFIMPAFDVNVSAVYEEDLYTVTVTGGSGSGQYHPGDTVTVSSDPLPEGKRRVRGWRQNSGSEFAHQYQGDILTSSFVMPAHDVWLAAVYEDTQENGGGRQWMRLDGNQVTVNALDKDGKAVSGKVWIASYLDSGRILDAAFAVLSADGNAQASVETGESKIVTAFFMDDANHPLTSKVYTLVRQ